MDLRSLGNHGLKVAPLGLGCMPMSDFYDKPASRDDTESIATIRHAIDIGMSFLDTSDMYGMGHNESLVGRAIEGCRERVTLATKFGIMRSPGGEWLGINGRPEYVREACDASLKRLGVDTIDLYYQHRVDPNVPIEETVGAMAELVDKGKVRFLGLSEASVATMRRAAAVHPISALQTEYSLWTRDPEAEHLSACRDLGIGFVAYSPLGRGFLTGSLNAPNDLPADDWRRDNPRFQGENFEQNRERVRMVEAIAEEKQCTAAQIALAWLLAKWDQIVPIPGTRRSTRVDENFAARQIRLSKDDLERLGATFGTDETSGARYPETAMAHVNR